MFDKPEISIIIPVYKTGKYLSRCVGSILQQTYTDFELILVDDGSPDNSGKLCDKYALKDSRIKVIHKENGGVSSARNAGLEIAKGKYIIFVDSDDWVAENYLAVLIEPMIKYDIQLASVSYEERGVLCRTKSSKTKLVSFLELSEKDRVSYFIMQKLNMPCVNIFLSSIITKNNLRFKIDMHLGEDTSFLRSYLSFCEKIYMVDNVVYFYNKFNGGSLTKRLDERIKQWNVLLIDELGELLKKVGISEKCRSRTLADRAFDSLNDYLIKFALVLQNQNLMSEIEKALESFEKYLNLDLGWADKQDEYYELRQAVLKKDVSEIYSFYQKKFKRNKLRKILSKIKRCLLVPYLERKRDGLNKYKYLDK